MNKRKVNKAQRNMRDGRPLRGNQRQLPMRALNQAVKRLNKSIDKCAEEILKFVSAAKELLK